MNSARAATVSAGLGEHELRALVAKTVAFGQEIEADHREPVHLRQAYAPGEPGR